ncbi:MAG: fasciclin domain-containing protein [Rhodobacteraceae bacterium]|nr:fasciclin domain-containing protein [Paracoccaceae bacterium]
MVVAAALLAATVLPSAAASGRSIVDVAKSQGVFGTLLAAAQAAGLADDLDEVDGLTVFAPTDEAFEKLPHGTVDDLLKPENRDTLRAIIGYHIVPGRLRASHIPAKFKLVETLNGCERVKTRRYARSGRVTVDGVDVVTANVRASNGIIHVIDEVLLPARNCP